MKRFAPILFLFVLMLAITACSPAPQGSLAVQLPEQLVVFVGWFVNIALVYAAQYVFERFGIDIKDRAAEIASAVSAIVVLFINYGLGLVPAAYDNFINGLFAFLIVFLPATGIFSLFLRNKKRNA